MFLSQAFAERQVTAISKQDLSHWLRKGLPLACVETTSPLSQFALPFWGVEGLVVRSPKSSSRSYLVKKQGLELCCNHVRNDTLRTCQTSKAGSRRRKCCGFLSARDSPLGLSKRSGKIKALPWCQQSPRMVEIPGGIGVLTCSVTEMSPSFSM